MSAIYKNGIAYGGAASAANLISATSGDGTATNVQAELNNINENISSLNDDLTYTEGSGIVSNQYCTCNYWWVKRGHIATLSINMTPLQDIVSSTGSVQEESNMPVPYDDIYGAVYPQNTPGDKIGRSFSLTHGGAFVFYGPYTKDHVYKAGNTFVVAL